jgi:uridine kinase
MIGDIINIKPAYLATAKDLVSLMQKQGAVLGTAKYVIGIGGESGSGKSVTAMCLQKILQEQNIKSIVLHQDDYFILPPTTNHNNRLSSISNVGLQEVNLGLLKDNVTAFRSNAMQFVKPVVNYHANIILEEIVHCADIAVLIIEGTYVLSQSIFDFTVFMDRNYLQTKKAREIRGREKTDAEFIEKVLEIEHAIIRPLKKNVTAIVNIDYSVIANK